MATCSIRFGSASILQHCEDKNLEASLWSKITRAVIEFDMIQPGDRVAIGVSGGKDSLVLLRFLYLFRERKKFDFDIVAVHVITDVSLEQLSYKPTEVEEIFKEMGITYEIAAVNLNDPTYNKKGKVDCYWCSTQKRRLLFAAADKHNCNKVAMGHHQDDIVQTNFMNMMYVSSLQTMRVNHSFFEGKYNIIRPLCLVREKEIIKYAKIMELPTTCNCCRVAKDGRREEVAEILLGLEKQVPNLFQNVFQAFSKNNAILTSLGHRDIIKGKPVG